MTLMLTTTLRPMEFPTSLASKGLRPGARSSIMQDVGGDCVPLHVRQPNTGERRLMTAALERAILDVNEGCVGRETRTRVRGRRGFRCAHCDAVDWLLDPSPVDLDGYTATQVCDATGVDYDALCCRLRVVEATSSSFGKLEPRRIGRFRGTFR